MIVAPDGTPVSTAPAPETAVLTEAGLIDLLNRMGSAASGMSATSANRGLLSECAIWLTRLATALGETQRQLAVAEADLNVYGKHLCDCGIAHGESNPWCAGHVDRPRDLGEQ